MAGPKISWTLLKMLSKKWREIHWLMAVVSIAFFIYFLFPENPP